MGEVRDTPISNNHDGTNSPTQQIDTIACWRPAVYTEKSRNQHQSDNHETNNKTKPFIHIIHDDSRDIFCNVCQQPSMHTEK